MESVREILRKIRRLEIKTRGSIDAAFAGQYRSVFKGRGMNFEEVREYQPGDEVRTIDWNVTARYDEPFVKKFTEERELSVMLAVDVSASGNFGSSHLSKRELAAEIACLLAFSAIRNQDKVGLLLFSDRVECFIPPRKGRGHALRLIREILFLTPRGNGTNPGAALHHLNQILHRRSIVFLLSDFQAPDFSRELSITSRRHDLIALPMIDPCEEHLPDIGIVTLEDPETGEQLEINTSSPHLRRAHQRAFLHAHEERLALFRKLRIDTISLRTQEDYLPALRNFFRTRERRLRIR